MQTVTARPSPRVWWAWLDKERLGLAAILAVGAGLLLIGLDRRPLSFDEAWSANLSWNTLRFGYPVAWDGRNFATTSNGVEYDEQLLCITHPWLAFYVGALSLWLGGKTVAGARLLFALAGLATLFLTYAFASEVSRSRTFGLLALLVTSLSVPLLLLMRQAHYYPLVTLFAVAALYWYARLLARPNGRHVALTAGSLLALYYSNYAYFLPLFGGMALHYLVFFRRRLDPGLDRRLLFATLALGALALPWLLYGILPLARVAGGGIGGLNHGLYGLSANFLSSAWKIQAFTYPFITLAALLGLLWLLQVGPGTRPPLRRALPMRQPDLHWVALLAFVVGLNVASVSLLWRHPWLPYRYVLLGISLGPTLCAYTLQRVLARQRWVGLACLALVVGTNLLNVFPYALLDHLRVNPASLSPVVKSPYTAWAAEDDLYGYVSYFARPDSYLVSYVRELTTHHPGRTEVVADYLAQEAAEDDVVLVETVEAENLIFLTGLRVADRLMPGRTGFMDTNNAYGWSEAVARRYAWLTSYPPERIKWIVAGGYYPPSQFRTTHADDYRPVRLAGQDYYVSPVQDIDADRVLPWQERPSTFVIYRRRG